MIIMFENPERLQGGPDLSALEAEFAGSEFDFGARFGAQQSALNDAANLASEAASTAYRAKWAQDQYDSEIVEAEKPKSPWRQMQHLHRAYSAALDLKGLGEPIGDDVLPNLEVRIVAMQALIDSKSASQSSED